MKNLKNMPESLETMTDSARLRPLLWIFLITGAMYWFVFWLNTSAPSHWLKSVAWPVGPVLKFRDTPDTASYPDVSLLMKMFPLASAMQKTKRLRRRLLRTGSWLVESFWFLDEYSQRSCPLPIMPLCLSREEGMIHFFVGSHVKKPESGLFSDWIRNNTDDLRCSNWPKCRHPLVVVDFSLHFCLRNEQWIHTRVRYKISADSVFFEFEECLNRNLIHWNIFHLIVY